MSWTTKGGNRDNLLPPLHTLHALVSPCQSMTSHSVVTVLGFIFRLFYSPESFSHRCVVEIQLDAVVHMRTEKAFSHDENPP